MFNIKYFKQLKQRISKAIREQPDFALRAERDHPKYVPYAESLIMPSGSKIQHGGRVITAVSLGIIRDFSKRRVDDRLVDNVPLSCLMPEPKGNDSSIDACLKQLHRRAVAKHVR